jgi:hypothetical protein
MSSTYGFKKIVDNVTNNQIPNPGTNNELLTVVRVKSIVLDKTHPRFKNLGEWDALGTIEYENVIKPNAIDPLPTAKPLYGNTKNYPLVNEIVYILSLPSTLIGQLTSNTISYYVSTVALWNHPHHNAYPSNSNEKPPTQQKGYNQTELGNTSKITDQTLEINLGNTFIERSNIHPLLPFEGDVIYEGRWGNSIRLGSTNKRKILGLIPDALNNWSTGKSTSGDPILILRNGQGQQAKEGWLPIEEDINNDESSIYLTSTQKIPLELPIIKNNNYFSYFSYKNNPPVAPNKYSDKQVIISSGRLVFNSSEDHILLSSAKSISLSSNLGVNIDTSVFTVQSSNIYLGSKNATEPLLLGSQTTTLLNQLINNLAAFAQVCSILVATPQGTLTPLNIAATQLQGSLKALQANLDNLKSKYNYTV